MSDQNQEQKSEFLTKIKEMETEALIKQKMALVKDLQKNTQQLTGGTVDLTKAVELLKEVDKVVKQFSTMDVTKAAERAKIQKLLEKSEALIAGMSILDQLSLEKNKLSKSLEKVAEVASQIPLVEKVIKERGW